MFDDIRPYTDSELPQAMQAIVSDPAFDQFVQSFAPSIPADQLAAKLLTIQSAWQLQHEVIAPLLQQMLQHTATSFTLEGAEHLDPTLPYLFISNHRDIVLDAALLLLAYDRHSSTPIEITFGENLMQNPILTHMGRANRMFRTVRNASSPLQFSRAILHLSHYIRHTITTTGHCVWIAQRDGRTKDGLDRTLPSLIKMLASSSRSHPAVALSELNIVPVSVSYEWEPCDAQKAHELLASQQGPYTKAPDEDYLSILAGIRQPKGDICFTLGTPLTLPQLQPLEQTPAFYTQVAHMIDHQIITNYRLSPNNYIAFDLRAASATYSDRYSDHQRNQFVQHLDALCADTPQLRPLLLDIYANPVSSKLSLAGPETNG